VELVDENRDQFLVHELIPQPIQDLGFQLIPPHREEVVTRAFVSGGGATVVELTDFRASTLRVNTHINVRTQSTYRSPLYRRRQTCSLSVIHVR
jgi:hypothetical protein